MKLHAALLLLAGCVSASASSSVHDVHPRHVSAETDFENEDAAEELEEAGTNLSASFQGSVVGVDAEGGIIAPSTLRRNLQENPLDLFKPLSCNVNIDSVDCTPWSLKSFVLTDEVEIPCGECITVDVADGTEIYLPGGLNILGKLAFPDNKKVTIKTTHIYVQGVLYIRDTNKIAPENQSVKFHFTGTEDHFFEPHVDNAIGCPPDGTCAVGIKPFLVAGGRLDVEGWGHGACPTWTHIQDFNMLDMTAQTAGDDFPLPASAPDGCDRALSDATFDANGSHGWRSQLGVLDDIVTDDATGNSWLRVHNRTHDWQGPYMDLSNGKACVQSGQDYTFAARIRLSTSDGSSQCSTTGTGCPAFVVNRKESDEDEGSRAKVDLTEEEGLETTDGEWFNMVGKFTFAADEADPDNVFVTLTIEGPEPGVVIEVDDLYVGLPHEDQYPDASKPGEVCDELFIADSGADGYFDPPRYPYPLYQNRRNGEFRIKTEIVDGQTNNYYSINREREYESLSFPVPRGCARGGARYDISFRARMHYDGDFEHVKVQFIAGSKSVYSRNCDNTFGNGRGWVECKVSMTLNQGIEDYRDTAYVRIYSGFSGTSSDPGFDVTFDMDFDDFSVKLNHGPVESLVVEEEVAQCWGAGSDVMITSHTSDYDGQQTGVKVASVVNRNDGYADLTLDGVFERPTSVADDPNTATEIALLTRNVVFYSEDYYQKGAAMTVKHTTGVPQILSGVQLDRFGQWGKVNRYSFHFDRCDNVKGSLITKNLVTRAGYQGLVLQGTHNVTMSQNVVYHSRGHGIMLKDGKEWDNRLEFNLVAKTTNPGNKDYSNFYIKSVRNYINRNVAAGALDRGFYFHISSSIATASRSLPGGNPNPRLELGLEIRDNTAHSCHGYGVLVNLWQAQNSIPIENFKVFKNRGHGIYVRGRYVNFTGAYVSDNRYKGIYLDRCDSCEVIDSDVAGTTALAVDQIRAGLRYHWCVDEPATLGRVVGIDMRHYYDNHNYRSPGLKMTDVRFSGFKDTACARPTAITFDDRYRGGRGPHFDQAVSLSGSTNLDGGDLLVDFCRAETVDVQDVVYHDLDSSLHPNGPGSYLGGASAIVSDHSWMTGFAAEGACHPVADRCATYCEGLCLRNHNFRTTLYETEDVVAQVTDLSTNKTIEIGGNHYYKDTYSMSYYYEYRTFSLPLPSPGGPFEVRFFKDGQHYWPTFVERSTGTSIPTVDPAPACWGGGNGKDEPPADITLVPPESPPSCSELVKNGDAEMEGGNYTHWYHASGGVEAVSGTGVDGSHAIASTQRDAYDDGLAFYVDTTCMDANVGREYEMTAKMKLEGTAGIAFDCDPDSSANPGGCPRFSVYLKKWRPESQDYLYRGWYDIATSVRPYQADADGYTLVTGTFIIPQDFADADSVRFTFNKAQDDLKMFLDDVSIHPLVTAERTAVGSVSGELVANHDMEDTWPGDIPKHWAPRREYAGTIEVVTPGSDGATGKAVKVTGRMSHYQGPGQFLNPGTFFDSSTEYEVMAKFRTSKGGVPLTCDMNAVSDQELSCPVITIKTVNGQVGAEVATYPTVAWVADTGSSSSNHWGTIHGTFFPSENMLSALRLFAYVQYPKAVVDIELDDFSIKAYSLDCGNVVTNGDFEEGDARGWEGYGAVDFTMVSPEADGSNNAWALEISGRTDPTHGAQQSLEMTCLDSNNQYLLEAKFKLTEGECNPNVIHGEDGCPTAALVSVQDDNGNRDRVVAATIGAADNDGWYEMRGIFEVYKSDMGSDRIWLRFRDAPAGVVMIIDDVVMTKVANPIS